MPSRIVDLSARSEVIRAEPFNLHFWQCTPAEFRTYLGRPRDFLRNLGIALPHGCRIETVIENHDWLESEAPNFESEGGEDTVICNLGVGAAVRSVYRVMSYARDEAATGNVEKTLLHGADRQQVKHDDETPARKEKNAGKSGKGKKAKTHRGRDQE